MIDMTEINEMLGMIFATESLGTGSRYMKSLIHSAFYDANDEFNREIVTTALASPGKKFNHMFEWGTQGINTARSDIRPKPNEERARLWKTVMVQGTKNNVISFIYKDSVATVPKPTVQKTGIDKDILDTLNDHVFWNKAKVMETGQKVSVSRINAKALFIPLAYANGKPSQPGFMLLKGPTAPTPGVSEYYTSHKGTFTAFFDQFWEGRGSTQMQDQVEYYFDIDLKREILRIESMRGRYGVPNVAAMQGQIKRAQRTVRANLERAAAKREGEH
jgi:hypothetical protein